MKLNKLIASASAVAVAAAAMGVSASAVLKVVDQDGHFRSGTGSWMPVIYSNQTFDASEKDYTDYGIDCTKIASVEVTLTTDDTDFFDGSFGGAIVLSSKSTENADHNWNGKEYWGTYDDTVEPIIETVATDKAVVFERTGDYTYTGVMKVDDSNCVYEGYDLVQIAVQEWGQDMSNIVIKSMVLKDADGNVMISFDEAGKASLPLIEAGAEAPAAEEEAPAEEAEEAAEEEVAEEEEAADEEEVAEDEDEDEDDAADEEEVAEEEEADEEDEAVEEEAPAVEEEAPAAEEAPATTAPAAGDVAAATDSSKGSPDTGIADVAAVAGLAIVAGGAVLVSKKRK